jgi:hypothetical protein
MKPLLGVLCAVFLAGGVFADPYSAAIRQAQNVSTKVSNANRQLDENPATVQPPHNNPAVNPMLQATLQNIENLRNDFATIGNATNTALSIAQKQSLTNDLATAAQSVKPQAVSISKLADDLTMAISGNEKLRAQYPKLAQYVHAVSNSSFLTAAQQQTIFGDVHKILVNGGAAPDDATTVVNDIKEIASETK